MKHISLLLGAGFSVNKGYPTGNDLNSFFVELHPEDFCIHTAGIVMMKVREEDDPYFFSSDSKNRYFVTRLIQLFRTLSDNHFNYEEFYDFYNSIERGERKSKEFETLCENFRQEFKVDTNNTNLISATNKIVNQLIALKLVDWEGNKFYEPVHYGKPIYPGYSGFLYCLEDWGKDSTVHVHTLNHDLFFEIFKDSDWLNGELSDGFEEMGSPFYGNFKDNYKVRLPRFTNRYDTKFRLYKLHGSVDQIPYHIQGKGIDAYVKLKKGIGTAELFKEISDNGKLQYINDWINYHPDFLSGTTSKILRYREPWYYDKVFCHFETNLEHSDKLIVIGYGCLDTEINRLIEEKYDFHSNPVFLIDPQPSDNSHAFIQKFNARLVEKTPNELTKSDFEK